MDVNSPRTPSTPQNQVQQDELRTPPSILRRVPPAFVEEQRVGNAPILQPNINNAEYVFETPINGLSTPRVARQLPMRPAQGLSPLFPEAQALGGHAAAHNDLSPTHHEPETPAENILVPTLDNNENESPKPPLQPRKNPQP